jgi:hypothetical protein
LQPCDLSARLPPFADLWPRIRHHRNYASLTIHSHDEAEGSIGMYQDHSQFKAVTRATTPDAAPSGFAATALAWMVVAALPLIGLALLLDLVWRDLKLAGRAVRRCVKTYAEEFARR